jgi:hypothetical protein
MIRSVLLSTCIYVVAFIGAGSLGIQLSSTGWVGGVRFASLVGYALFSGAVVGLSGLLLWPLLRAMRRLQRPAVLAAGALLAAVPLIVLLAIFWDPGDGDTIPGLLRFWLRVPGEFLLGFTPLALATGALAWFATKPDSAPRVETRT